MLDKKRIRLEQSIDSTKNHLTAEIRRLEKEISDDSQEIENEKKSIADLETLKRREKSLVEILKQLPIIRAEIESNLSHIRK